nr:hypothetical protein [uncultured Desulfobacter sp.]
MYKPILRIVVRHGYYSNGSARNLGFVPSEKTEKIITGAGLICKAEEGGISLFYDEDKKEALELYADDSHEELRLCFKVRSTNPLFQNFTEMPVCKGEKLLFFDSRNRVEQPDGCYGLSSSQIVSGDDLVFIDDIEHLVTDNTIITRRERLIKPLFVLSIRLGERGDALFEPTTYCLVFEGRKTVWKYYLMGAEAGADFSIVDVNNAIFFSRSDDGIVAGNRVAKIFTSGVAIPLMERSPYHFQLKRTDAKMCRVVIKRLPVASPDQICSRVINGNKAEDVSEIFINY